MNLLITCDFLGGLEKIMYFSDCKLDVLKLKILATLTIRVENRSVLAKLKRVLESMKGVSYK